MKRAMVCAAVVALCAIVSCSPAATEEGAGGSTAAPETIPTGGPIPDNRGFDTDDAERVAAVEVVVRHVAGQVYVIAGAGGNMTVMAGDDGIFLVDTNFNIFFDDIMAAIRRISDGPIRFVVNTHSHGDHTENNANFAREGAVIVDQPNLRRALIEAGDGPDLPGGLPVITSAEPMTFHFNGEEILFIPLKPSHTDGDAAVYFTGSDVWSFGDVYRTDYPSLNPGVGATLANFEEIYQMALDMTTPNTIFVPGHGQLSPRSELQGVLDAVITIHGRMRDMIAQGMTLEQVMEARPSREFDAQYSSESKSPTTGNTVERVYTRFYADITRELAEEEQ